MNKYPLNVRIYDLCEKLYSRKWYLHKIYKFHNVMYDTYYKDMYFIFDSRYGQTEIIIYYEDTWIIKYSGKINFEKRLTKSVTCDIIEDNMLRELELYTYKVLGMPSKESLWTWIMKSLENLQPNIFLKHLNYFVKILKRNLELKNQN